MEIAWLITGLKTAIGAGLTLLVNHYRKPAIVWIRGAIKLNEKVAALEKENEETKIELSIAKSRDEVSWKTDDSPVFRTNMQGELIYVNQAWLDLLEYTNPEHAYGVRFLDVIHHDDKERVLLIMDDMKNHPTSFADYIAYQTRITRKKLIMLVVSEIIKDKNGKMIEVFGRLHTPKNEESGRRILDRND